MPIRLLNRKGRDKKELSIPAVFACCPKRPLDDDRLELQSTLGSVKSVKCMFYCYTNDPNLEIHGQLTATLEKAFRSQAIKHGN